MCNKVDRETFFNEYELFLRKNCGLAESTIGNYLRKIRSFLESGYSVADLCGGIDQLIEDYGRGGVKYKSADKGQTRAALGKVRKFIKGEFISTIRIAYKESSNNVWQIKGIHVAEYLIENEKIIFKLNTITKKTSKKISPVKMCELISILQEAKQKDYLDNSYMIFQEKNLLIDAPSPNEYEYNFDDVSGHCFGSIFGEGNEPQRLALKKRYNDWLNQLINPYTIL